jgi:hypothetical protein
VRTCCKKRQKESASDQHWQIDRQCGDYSRKADTKATEEHVPSASVPISHPDEERSGHLTDLEGKSVNLHLHHNSQLTLDQLYLKYGKDYAGASIARSRETKVLRVVW